MKKVRLIGIGLIALSVFLIWKGISDGSFTISDDGREEVITSAQNPIFFNFLMVCFAGLGVVGGVLVSKMEPLGCEVEEGANEENEHFQWSSKSFARLAVVSIISSTSGLIFITAIVICLYISDFSSNSTRWTMSVVLFLVLSVKVLLIALLSPKNIMTSEEGIVVDKWLQKAVKIKFSQIAKITIDEKRISIWFNESDQLEFPSAVLLEEEVKAFKRVLKEHGKAEL